MHRRQQLVVDSKWRRLSKHPYEWSYNIPFPEPLVNVVSVDLVQAIMPNTQRTVNTFNSKFQMTPVGSPTVTVDIPPGNYEPSLLLAAIQSSLADSGVSNPNLSYATDTNLVMIACDQPFSLPFATGDAIDTSIHRNLGFSNTDIMNVLQVTSPYGLFLPPPPYVTVDVAEVPWPDKNRTYSLQRDVVEDTRPQLNEMAYAGFVTLDTDYDTFKFWKASANEIMRQVFPPTDIRQFSIMIRDDKGNPV